MYRFSIGNENWILRFSPNVVLEEEEKESIIKGILQLGKELSTLSHGQSFVIMNEEMGLTVLNVEKIPSFILTVSNRVEKEKWYVQEKKGIRPFL
ncbi:hypothetical protein [Niallia sp. NCCP-28]|uniref:hypothetical protein n=1 Tax=Niallia sp. NCCP-28 TaxID=2934712 RepID=UPI00207DC91F|nr:hypothetical protein [Niallia sp. NCCP-28]GKU80935.1 hypothetical protein NCCP28_03310 [Niallia sp. NCCP-28]